jgi:3-methyladenine DNA glycosylase/8-oxoguanine DNA glycosylase
MHVSRMVISPPPRFSFWRTVYSHGWCALPPFSVDKENRVLHRILTLSSNDHVECTLSEAKSKLVIRVESLRPLLSTERSLIKDQISQCLRMDEDFSSFYQEARRHRHYRWISALRVGRLLRAPTVFEDVVKMICTTNCSWALTENMVGNLTSKLGSPLNNSYHSFPLPEKIAAANESFLRKEIKTGYRSPYLLELAERVASGRIDIESWRHSTLPTNQLYEQVLSVKGIGKYAAGNIMKLLGRYDYLGLDSWVRKKFSELHRRGRAVSDTSIERHYASLGKWRGLFFWLEMTKDWHAEKFPF